MWQPTSPSAEGTFTVPQTGFHSTELSELRSMTDVKGVEGLTSQAVDELRQTHGFNEVKTKPTPEWKKLLRRYTDWVSIIIVSASKMSYPVLVRHSGSILGD